MEQEMDLIFNNKIKPALFTSGQKIMFLLLLNMGKAAKKVLCNLWKDLVFDKEG